MTVNLLGPVPGIAQAHSIRHRIEYWRKLKIVFRLYIKSYLLFSLVYGFQKMLILMQV